MIEAEIGNHTPGDPPPHTHTHTHTCKEQYEYEPRCEYSFYVFDSSDTTDYFGLQIFVTELILRELPSICISEALNR